MCSGGSWESSGRSDVGALATASMRNRLTAEEMGRSAARLFEPSGWTLEDAILGVWEDLTAGTRPNAPSAMALSASAAAASPAAPSSAEPSPSGSANRADRGTEPPKSKQLKMRPLCSGPIEDYHSWCGLSDRGGEKTPRGKSGHQRARAVGNAHPGKPAGKCHRNTRPMARPHVSRAQAKVKGCGKSAPAPR